MGFSIYNYGEIKFSRDLTQNEFLDLNNKFLIGKIGCEVDGQSTDVTYCNHMFKKPEINNEIKVNYDCGSMVVTHGGVEFNEYNDRYMADMLTELSEYLDGIGVKINTGQVEFYGDYNGCTYVDNGVVYSLDEKDRWSTDATDKEIISVLEKRGYSVFKNNELVRGN